MAIDSDFTINYTAKTITHSGGATVYPVLEFFQWCASTFAFSEQMDDDYAFLSDTPTVYRWVNSWDMGDETSYEFLSGGSIATSDGNDLYSNLFSIGTQESGTFIYIIQDGSLIQNAWWPEGNVDILLKVKSGGTLIDSGNVLAMAREWGDAFDHNFADMSGGGSTPVGINTSADINNDSVRTDVSLYGITLGAFTEQGYSNDLNNGNGVRTYDVEIDCNGATMKQVYEFLKFRTDVSNNTSFDYMNGAPGQQYRGASTGYTDVKAAPFGTLAGTTFFAARGVWLTNYATADFTLTDSSGVLQNPPDLQKVNINHPSDLVGTQIFVAERSGTAIIKDQYGVASSTSNSVTLSANVNANKAPISGSFRIGDTAYAYTGFSTTSLTGVTPDPTGDAVLDASLYIPLLDTLATTLSESSDNLIYSGAFDVKVVVRKYGFKPFTQDTAFGATGLTLTPILTTDPQAT
jgi:hypothetical protein